MTTAKRETPGGGDRSPLITQYGLKARAGKTYRLRQIVSLVPSVMHGQPDRHAERLAAFGAHQGFEALRAANRAEWQELWKGRILLHGAEPRLAATGRCRLLLHEHFGACRLAGLHLHVRFRDLARLSLLLRPCDVGHRELLGPAADPAAARSRRGLAGVSAAQPRWRAQQCPGIWPAGLAVSLGIGAHAAAQEAAPSPGTAAWHEDHVSLDVALAFAQYAHATGDGNFLRDKAWPVLSGVADWIASRAHRGRRGWEIRRSMGIAERKTGIATTKPSPCCRPRRCWNSALARLRHCWAGPKASNGGRSPAV